MLFHYVLTCVILAGFAATQDIVLALPSDLGDTWQIGNGFTLLEKNRLDHGQTSNLKVNGTMYSCNLGLPTKPVRDDYTLTPGIGWHKLHTRAVVWDAARKTCMEEGGHLAILNSVAEANVLRDMLTRSGPMKDSQNIFVAYIGVHDLFTEGDWVTVHGHSLAKTGYTDWSNKWGGQPDNARGIENCGVLMTEGGMNDVACNVLLAFFCELPLLNTL